MPLTATVTRTETRGRVARPEDRGHIYHGVCGKLQPECRCFCQHYVEFLPGQLARQFVADCREINCVAERTNRSRLNPLNWIGRP
jgi:hypothetical protein